MYITVLCTRSRDQDLKYYSIQTNQFIWKEKVSFNDAINTFYLRFCGVGPAATTWGILSD